MSEFVSYLVVSSEIRSIIKRFNCTAVKGGSGTLISLTAVLFSAYLRLRNMRRSLLSAIPEKRGLTEMIKVCVVP